MSDMPMLGEQPKQTPLVPIAITAIVVGCLSGGLFWIRSRPAEVAPAPEPVAAAVVPVAAPDPAGAPSVPGVAAPAPKTPVAPVNPAAAEGLRAFSVSITGPLESAIISSEGKEVGSALTQVVNRSLVWWLRVPQDLVKGDRLTVVYATRDGQEPLVHAVRFTSRKLGQTFETYRFKATTETFPRFYQADGSELEERLVDGPLDSWEQITSLLRDGRRHKGVDFKTAVGTPVKATFDGVVVRKNWNFRGNGNSIELHETGGQGRTALFLHLSEVPASLAVGQKVKRGEVIAKSGNTGHSFAPHLHYQLMSGERVLDPFESHRTTRSALPATERPAFDKRKSELEALFPAEAAIGG